jgi:3-oxoacyl-[acyl-carrier protein] reductase
MTAVLPEQARADLTAQIPLGRLGSPDDVAWAACFLASDEAAYITGHVVAVNGGMYM